MWGVTKNIGDLDRTSPHCTLPQKKKKIYMKAFLQFPLSDFAIFDITTFALCFFFLLAKKGGGGKGAHLHNLPPAAKLPGRKVEKKEGGPTSDFAKKKRRKIIQEKKHLFTFAPKL